MSLRMYDLAAAEDDRLFSPYCWRTKLAIAHKGMTMESIPWRFTEPERLAAHGGRTVPVLLDGERVVHDSWAIALYLEETYPDRPALFGGPQSRALTLGFRHWVERVLHAPMLRAVITDLHDCLHPKDKEYFRTTREKRFGKTLETLGAEREENIALVRALLDPVRATLAAQPWIAGASPAYADYVLFGAFMWTRSVSPAKLLAEDDPVHAWRERMLDLHGGYARRAKGHPV